MKKFSIILVSVLAAVLLTGCLEKKIVVPQTMPAEERGDGSFDVNRLYTFCTERLSNEKFPLGVRIDIQPDGENGVVCLVWSLKEAATKEDACRYGEAFIRAFNDAIVEQDPSFELSSEDSYGEFFQIFDAQVIIFKEKDETNPANYLVNQTVSAGTDEHLRPLGE